MERLLFLELVFFSWSISTYNFLKMLLCITSDRGLCLRFILKLHFTKVTSSTVCPYHVTYAFQSESTLYTFLNVKELLV